jgi:3-hydroxyacyl-CoA dehydrogenase/enoyl-CoA hydratase/3-hydroxybutyryl-CoA epimerase
MDVLLQGPRFKPGQAKEKGLVDELVDSRDDLVPAARAWILEKAGDAADESSFTQPWDRKGYKIPGGSPSSPALAQFLPAFPAMLRKQTKGAEYPAPRAIMAAAIEGAQVDFDTASTIESRYLTSLITGQNSKNMITAFFFNLSAINGGSLRPEGVEVFKPTKALVLGAGMMGAGIAYSCARSGIDVVLKDVSLEAAEKGKSYSDKLLTKAVERGKMDEEKKAGILARITATDDPQAAAGCDLVIEAVFEDPALKAKVFGEIQDIVNPDALLCSNTSTLPITELAEGVNRPEDFIGLHFFSPVDKMPLVEIIRGGKTSEAAVARAVDVVQQIRKTPIVVNDGRGFFTSRVFGTFVTEGAAMLAEGVPAAVIENAALQAGMPVGPLAVLDETSLSLAVHVLDQTRVDFAAEGRAYAPGAGELLIELMVKEHKRLGRAAGGGFYDYPVGAGKTLWPRLDALFGRAAAAWDIETLKDRLLYRQAIETARCLHEGVLTTAHDANIGSIFGIGFPAWTGGALQFVHGMGVEAFAARAAELAQRHGAGFALSDAVVASLERHRPMW